MQVRDDILTAHTKYGAVKGFEDEGVLKWLGIPYAKSPVEELRFKRPMECEPWDGVRQATAFAAKPWQFLSLGGSNGLKESEDCLFLNVWAPKQADKCPVFVWIYGGAFAYGEGTDPSYDGTAFAKQGVVYVTFNYRVGPLGFYDLSGYDDSFESNCGVADQIACLRWVKANIAAFGGDPDNVTIAGESAGGSAVYNMLASPFAKGLFHRAIAQSGLPDWTMYPEVAQLNMELFFKRLGITSGEVKKLKTMPVSDMSAAAKWVLHESCGVYPGIFPPGPVMDDLLPEKPWAAMAKGSAEGVDVIFGTNRDEATMFISKLILNLFPMNWKQISQMLCISGYGDYLPEFKRVYGGMRKKASVAAVGTDRGFWVDYVKCADAQSAHGKVYAYRFDFMHTIPRVLGMGAMHASEINHVLNTSGGFGKLVAKMTSKRRIASLRAGMHSAWVNFAKTGDPNGNLQPKWKSYDTAARTTFIFNDVCSVEMNPNAERFELWKDIALRLDNTNSYPCKTTLRNNQFVNSKSQ